MSGRRDFLKKVAKGAAYAAPVIYTLGTPDELMAIVTSRMMGIFGAQQAPDAPGQSGPQAPWAEPPASMSPWSEPAPWSEPPPGSQSPPGGSND